MEATTNAFADAAFVLNQTMHQALHTFLHTSQGQLVAGVEVKPGLNPDGSVFYDLAVRYETLAHLQEVRMRTSEGVCNG